MGPLAWSASKQRTAERRRKHVVQIDMKLRHEPNGVSGVAVPRNDRLGAELHILTGPQQTRIDRAGGLAATAIERRLERQLGHKDQTIEWRAKADVPHLTLQVGHTVFQRQPEFERVRMLLEPALTIGTARFCRN